LFGRGRLMALIDQSGIYESDINRAAAELGSGDDKAGSRMLSLLIANARARSLASREKISPGTIDAQLPPQLRKTIWRNVGWSTWCLGRDVLQNARAQSWIERKIADALPVTEKECLEYYKAHSEAYLQPARMRASHIFFAAPPGVGPEETEAKQAAAQAVSDRIARGEKFAGLVALSEDEASKKRGGDLNFFSESRMPADFWAALRGLRVGETSGVIRTQLGFHIVQLADSLPQRQMTPGDARAEITLLLENQKRAATLPKLTATLTERPEFIRSKSLSD
jgi:hypothetical protein